MLDEQIRSVKRERNNKASEEEEVRRTGTFTPRQLVETRPEGEENMALRFIDLERAYNTLSREMAMATLRWMGVPEVDGCPRGEWVSQRQR